MGRAKSRSLEPLTGLAMWASEPNVILLQKGDRGLGFSILDYQVRGGEEELLGEKDSGDTYTELLGEEGYGYCSVEEVVVADPLNPQETVIVIRSLVPGGVAEKDGRLIPGDRLVAVNGTVLEGATLDEAVAALKGAPRGPVEIAVAKPISVLESPGRVSN
ncbi:hypothetical protein HAZT_HAZT004050 [Hyalella azteca]|uniref:PDZ domain-containing protein n=1 Tax=Hyalella azteca TaxID=294128 RepID=A0A6A0GYI1_HYAAZ|nr:hypothetical protein HAZT_HAZT004050 [Hyalella azteca]